MIRIEQVSKRYHHHATSQWVLQDVNLEIPTGLSVGLLGQNGAGKSTLLNLIAGLDSPDKGKITRECRVSWPIGLAGGFKTSMTGRQNARFVARIHGYQDDVGDIIRRVEDFAEIGKAFDQPVSTYSTGMRARVAFGLSLAIDFDVYLSDEATAVGDQIFRQKAVKAFQERIKKSSLIMVSHGEGILRQLCQAGIWLHQGKAHWFDDIKDAIAAYHQQIEAGKPIKIPKANASCGQP